MSCKRRRVGRQESPPLLSRAARRAETDHRQRESRRVLAALRKGSRDVRFQSVVSSSPEKATSVLGSSTTRPISPERRILLEWSTTGWPTCRPFR